jgi:hypothetical protein
VFEINRDRRFPDLVLFSQPARDIHFHRVD